MLGSSRGLTVNIVDGFPQRDLILAKVGRIPLALRYNSSDLEVLVRLQACLPIRMSIFKLLGRISPGKLFEKCYTTWMEMPKV